MIYDGWDLVNFWNSLKPSFLLSSYKVFGFFFFPMALIFYNNHATLSPSFTCALFLAKQQKIYNFWLYFLFLILTVDLPKTVTSWIFCYLEIFLH